MFATNGVTEMLGIEPQRLVSKSFYFCMQEDSLQDAVRCLERAKANNSIAYLRFWYRDPLQDEAAVDRDLDNIIRNGPSRNRPAGVTGINGSLEQYWRGKPTGGALPMDGVHIWGPLLDEKKVGKPDLYSNIDLVHEEQEHDGIEEEKGWSQVRGVIPLGLYICLGNT
jgi:hypothetical protein